MTTHKGEREEALLPCPFCGGDAEIVHIEEGENAGGSCVCCKRCNASSNVEFEFKENFISNWNRRSSSAAERAVVEALMDATAHLAGSASAYRKYARRHSSVGRSEIDPFFTTRADDFDKAVERARLALSSVRGEGGDKQATRASGPTAPISTDTKGTTK